MNMNHCSFCYNFFLNSWYFNGYFIIGLRHIFFKIDSSVEELEAALNIFEPEAYIALVEFFEIALGDPLSIVVHPDIQLGSAEILCNMDEAGIAVFEDIVHQFLDHAENDELLIGVEPVAVIMEPATGVHAS